MLRESEIMQLLRAWEAAILNNHVVEEFERAFSMGLYVASCEICGARLFVETSAEHIFGRAVHEWCSGEKEALAARWFMPVKAGPDPLAVL